MKHKTSIFSIAAIMFAICSVSCSGAKEQTELEKYNEKAYIIGEKLSSNRGNTLAERKFLEEIAVLTEEAKENLNNDEYIIFYKNLLKASSEGHDWGDIIYENRIKVFKSEGKYRPLSHNDSISIRFLKEEYQYKFGKPIDEDDISESDDEYLLDEE